MLNGELQNAYWWSARLHVCGRRTLRLMLARLCATSAQVHTSAARLCARRTTRPSIKVGATIFADYTYQTDPKGTDADGNTSRPTLQRRARVHQRHRQHLAPISFRITPDIARETRYRQFAQRQLTFRLKYAYGQFNFDDWMTRGSLGTAWHAADAVGRLRGDHLPLPLPGHDLRRPRRFPVLVGRRRVGSLQLPATTSATSTRASTTARATTSPRPTTRRRFKIRGTLRPLPPGSASSRPAPDGLLRPRRLREGRASSTRGSSR